MESKVNGGVMNNNVTVICRTLFIRLLAHAPEALQEEAQENARQAIPALCFTEDEIRQELSEQEGWNDLSENERCEAVEWLLHSGDYENAGREANQAIAMAVMNYVADSFLEKEQRQMNLDGEDS